MNDFLIKNFVLNMIKSSDTETNNKMYSELFEAYKNKLNTEITIKEE